MLKKIINFCQFCANAHVSKDKIIEIQNKKLQKVIKHAYATTLFYRNLMDTAGIKPEHIKSVDDLSKLPAITKSQLQKHFSSVISNQYPMENCHVRTTSGSSGKMLKVLWDQDNFWARIFLFYRVISMIGYNPFKKVIYFLPVQENPGFSFGLFRQMGLSLDKPLDEIREILIRYKPHIISIYPSYAVYLGKYLTNKDIKQIGVKAISLNSEMILPSEAKIISDRFKCPVYEEYSSVEIGMIASMCSEKRMHIFSDNVVLEILDQHGKAVSPGEKGEIVLTTLNSFAMPFIRYRIGDYSILSKDECTCNSPFPLLERIEGRKDDSFKLHDGSLVPAWKIYEIIERPMEKFGMDKIVLSDFYLIQKKLAFAEFYYVKGPDFNQNYVAELKNKWIELFDNNLALTITELPDIERVKTVKRKYIHCELRQ